MARNMTDLSSDEEPPNYGQSWIQLCNTMDEVEHAVEWIKAWRTQWQLNEQQLHTVLMWIQLHVP